MFFIDFYLIYMVAKATRVFKYLVIYKYDIQRNKDSLYYQKGQ